MAVPYNGLYGTAYRTTTDCGAGQFSQFAATPRSSQPLNCQHMSNFISLAQGIEMTSTYRKEMENILAPLFKGKDILPVCETFDRASFETLLAETDATYIRIYLGMDKDLKIKIIAVAANSKNVDILPSAAPAALDGDDGNIVEDGVRCPTICPPPSDLNT